MNINRRNSVSCFRSWKMIRSMSDIYSPRLYVSHEKLVSMSDWGTDVSYITTIKVECFTNTLLGSCHSNMDLDWEKLLHFQWLYHPGTSSKCMCVWVCVSVGLMILCFFIQTADRGQLKITLLLKISTVHFLMNVLCVFNVYLISVKLLIFIHRQRFSFCLHFFSLLSL